MITKKLNAPVSLKSVSILLGVVFVGTALFFAGRAFFHWLGAGPKSPRQVKSEIRKYLKKQTGRSDFDKAAFDFKLKETVTLMQTNMVKLKAEIDLLQTNLNTASADVRKLRHEGVALQEQERSLRHDLRNFESTVADRQQRWTNRMHEVSLMQSNVFRSTTNLAALGDESGALQARLITLTNELSTLLTNIADLTARAASEQTNYAALQAESRAQSREVVAKERDVSRAQGDLAAKENKLTRQTNDVALAAEVAAAQTNLVQVQTALDETRSSITNLNHQAAQSQEKRSRLQEELAGLQRLVTTRQRDLMQARRDLANKEGDVATRERALTAAKASLAAAQTNLTTLETNVAALREQLTAKRSAWETRQKELAANGDAQAAKQKEATALQDQLQAKRKELADLQRTLYAKEQELGTQTGRFRNDIRKQVGEATTYEGIYFLIGQQLWVADKLLASKEPLDQQHALSLAVEASQHAAQSAEQHWLASRICEAYLLPNLELADAKGRTGYTPESILSHCSSTFERAEEIPNVVRTMRLSLDRALSHSLARADGARYYLGYALERTGELDEALKHYRQVQHSNYLRYAERRIPIVENKLKQQMAQK